MSITQFWHFCSDEHGPTMQYLTMLAIFLIIYSATWTALGWLPRAQQSTTTVKCAPLSKKFEPGDKLKINGEEMIVVGHDDTGIDIVRRDIRDIEAKRKEIQAQLDKLLAQKSKDHVSPAQVGEIFDGAHKSLQGKFTREQQEYMNSLLANERHKAMQRQQMLVVSLEAQKKKREAEVREAEGRAEADKIEWQKKAAIVREKADREFALKSKEVSPFCYWDHYTRKFYVFIGGRWKEIAQTDIAAHRSTQWPKEMVWDQLMRAKCFPNNIGVGTGYTYRGAQVVAETETDYIFDKEVKLVDDLQGYISWRIQQKG